MELPTPWTILQRISSVPEVEKAARREERFMKTIPQRKTFFRPYMSEALPTGTRNAAAERRYAVATQPSEMASMAKCSPIRGRATVTEEAVKGPRKELITAARSVFLLRLALASIV